MRGFLASLLPRHKIAIAAVAATLVAYFVVLRLSGFSVVVATTGGQIAFMLTMLIVIGAFWLPSLFGSSKDMAKGLGRFRSLPLTSRIMLVLMVVGGLAVAYVLLFTRPFVGLDLLELFRE